MGNLQKSLIAATGTTVYNNAVIPTGKKQTNGAINVANLPVYNRAGNYIEGQKVKVKGLDGKWYVGTAKAEGYIGTGGARQFKFLPDNPGGYKRAIDVDYNYNLYKKSMFERAYNKNLDFTAQEIQGKIVHDAPWRYKKNALNDYFKTPNDFVDYNKKVYLISTEQYGFDPKVNEQYAQLAADFTVGMLFEGGITCGIVAKSGMSKAVAGSGAGNIKKGGSEAIKGVGNHNTKISSEMEKKILEGQRKSPTKNEVIGGHSSSINNNNSNFSVEELSINPDSTKNVKFIKDLQDGNISKIKKSTVFPDSWNDSKIIDSIKNVGESPAISVRQRDGATWHRQIIDGVEIDVIKIGDNVISGYPTGKVNAPKPSGF